ncbi:MAG: hypothetical protein V4537_18105 [Pseudomonadota bacterium]
MSPRDRIQLDDHFAAAKARSRAAPTPTVGPGRAIAGLALLAGAIAATWWWALQPAPLAGPHQPSDLITVAERHAAVAGQGEPEARGPRAGGETAAQYQARLATYRAQDAASGASEAAALPPLALGDAGTPDRAAAGSAAPAPTRPAARATRPVAPAMPAALAAADRSALGLADRVNGLREDRAAHLRWLDACRKQHLVEGARAAIARARDGTAAHAAEIAAQNLAADIDTHQRESRRIEGLVATAERRLVDYCADHAQQVPALENPPETVTGVAAQPRPLPAASGPAPTIRPAAATARAQPQDPFGSPGR